MSGYYVVDDRRPGAYGILSGLAYRGRYATFVVRVTPRGRDKRSFFHIGEKLCSNNSSLDEIKAAYVSTKDVPHTDLPKFNIAPLLTKPGAKYGGIIRPVSGFGSFYAYEVDELERRTYLDLYQQLDNFMRRFSEIARVLQPSKANFSAFGYEIRSLLILTCTEVEALFKRLIFGGPTNEHGNMKLFFAKAATTAKLVDYRVKFNFFEEIDEIQPFADWSDLTSYEPLAWYQSYNATKHNRLSHLQEANLRSLVYSLAACAALLKAVSPPPLFHSPKHPSIASFEANFLVKSPEWQKNEHYWVVPGLPLRSVPVP